MIKKHHNKHFGTQKGTKNHRQISLTLATKSFASNNTMCNTIINTINSTINNMNNIISANQLKTTGVSALKSITKNNQEAIISVRGEKKYVVMTLDFYNYLRNCELETAIQQSKKDINEGKFHEESVEKHLKRISE